ncbi:MAG TPA: 30S ribosomal protein S8 [Candidatus Woesebacteria bacterium]|nr:30S ribosomal protein S8 [Candidatus Woesebacteria bacterium]HRT39793.1 30S ribosomal protein S8 [Candidatus Woesebacteria bacterium]
MILSLVNDYLIRLKNASQAGKKTVTAPVSKHLVAISELLKKHGFIESYKVEGKTLTAKINRVSEVRFFSTPGRVLYTKSSRIPWGKSRSSLIIISTSKGVMSQRQAAKLHLGGKLIAEIN